MRSGSVYYKEQLAGCVSQLDHGGYHFSYNPSWLMDPRKPSISLTLPKAALEFESDTLFPFFFNMIPEGANKRLICRAKRIDPDDYFGLLLAVAGEDTVGAVKVVPNV